MTTTTDEARVTDEEIASLVSFCRRMLTLPGESVHIRGMYDKVIVALADRLAAREADVKELLDLLESWERCPREHELPWDGRIGALPENVFWRKRKDLLKKLRGAP